MPADTGRQGTTRVALTVDGTEWAGWTELEVSRSMERTAGAFALGLTERWVGQPEPRPIKQGMACTVAIDGDVLVSGWIDDVEYAYDATSHQLVVRGRDKTGDILDCAAYQRPFEMGGLKLDEIARRLCAPFNIPVIAQVDMGRPIPRFAVQPGETVFDAIERGCRQRAVLPMPDGKGGLLLTRAGLGGPAAAALKLGGDDGNIISGKLTLSAKELFSDYIVMGQASSTNAFTVFGPNPNAPEASASLGPSARVRDPSVTRYRPTVVLAESEGSSVTFQQRAEWQRAVAVGKSVRGTRLVQDWRADGKLWHPNTLVRVTDRLCGLDNAEMLIAATKMRLTEAGTLTELEIALPDAYRLIPEGDLSGSSSAHDPFRIFDRPG
ncbi:phage baseplate assembly protein [Humitalea sp. 24SJ18S-53]|uniref:phage baseplate assembly protein n=1 Tax=Humitalea sp. 24SJ18S-53 TaxID=3422307 RepID=UPI003D674993